MLNPTLLPPALEAIRRAIFPDDALGPARIPPTDVETIAIKRESARVIVEVIPPYVRGKYFATEDAELMRADVEDFVGLLFGDSFINKHLIVEIVEVVFLKLFPEIGASTFRRSLCQIGLHGRNRRSKPYLSPLHTERRLLWALDHLDWDKFHWRPTIYEDESQFNLFGSDGRQYCPISA